MNTRQGVQFSPVQYDSSKFCRLCKTLKSLSEFSANNSRPDGVQAECKDCQRFTRKQWYTQNKKKQLVSVRRDSAKRRNKAKDFIKGYLEKHPCIDCGESDCVVLDFDHVRGKKYMAIGDMLAEVKSIDKIQKEIEKCDVRCGNCHRRRHHRERQGSIP